MSDIDEQARAAREKLFKRMAKEPVAWEQFREILESAEQWDPMRWPENHDWFLIRNVPMSAFSEVDIARVADVEDSEERRGHWERYRYILQLLQKGDPAWPVIVASSGQILDGFHRLAALRTLKSPITDVLLVDL